MSQEPTLPTTQTILEEMRAGFASIHHLLAQMDIRLDRIESFAHQTRSEILAQRADLKELREQLTVKS
jgi:hypothetical protein